MAAEGAAAKNSVSLDFTVTADAFDPDATSGPTSAAGYAEALAAKLGVDPEDITVAAVQKNPPNGPWEIEVRDRVRARVIRVRVRVRLLARTLTQTPNPGSNPQP